MTAAKQHTTPRDKWAAAYGDPLEQVVSAGRELAWWKRAERRVVQVVEPTPVAVEAPPVVIETPGIAAARAASSPAEAGGYGGWLGLGPLESTGPRRGTVCARGTV